MVSDLAFNHGPYVLKMLAVKISCTVSGGGGGLKSSPNSSESKNCQMCKHDCEAPSVKLLTHD